MNQTYRSLEVTGLELEYPIVGRDLGIRRLVPQLLETLAGEPSTDAVLGDIGLSNEFVDHVVEIKNEVPLPSLTKIEENLATGVREVMALLRRDFDASLLPTGMHPWMRPGEAARWSGEGREIYETYARIFPVVAHGWVNVQSCHVNLPFGTEEECCRMMNAVAMLLPYLPAVSASSPLREGRVTAALDGRLQELLDLQGRVPESCGRVVPELMTSFTAYREQVFEPMYRALDRIPGAHLLRHEFFNSRGAILRFDRAALEVRVLDTQECVKMDVSMAALVRACVRQLMDEQLRPGFALPSQDLLVADYRATVLAGRDAVVAAPHAGGGRAGVVLERLIERARPGASADERPYLELAGSRVAKGSLSEQLRREIGLPAESEVPEQQMRELYAELQRCLERNEAFAD